jgi:hypothetical protein
VFNNNVVPRVKLTGVKPNFNRKCGLAFWYYKEPYDPKVENVSKNVLSPHAEPCITLYLSGYSTAQRLRVVCIIHIGKATNVSVSHHADE